jgi:protein-S-isoprenylcysteine O-methyltransferase Ste14
MYTAMVGMLLGTAIISGQWHGLVGVAICAAAYWRKIRIEEPHLERRFGPEYEAYRRSSWALIPGLV